MMIAFFAAVIINHDGFARFVRTKGNMTFGNFIDLPVSLAFFSFLALLITAGTAALCVEVIISQADILGSVDNVDLTIIEALVGSTSQRDIFDLRCSERTHDGTNRSPWLVARAEG